MARGSDNDGHLPRPSPGTRGHQQYSHGHVTWGPQCGHQPPPASVKTCQSFLSVCGDEAFFSVFCIFFVKMILILFVNKACNLQSEVRHYNWCPWYWARARGKTRTFVWIGSGVTPLKWPQQPKSHNPALSHCTTQPLATSSCFPPTNNQAENRYREETENTFLIRSWRGMCRGEELEHVELGTQRPWSDGAQMGLTCCDWNETYHRESDFLLRLIKTFLSFNLNIFSQNVNPLKV